MPKAKLQTLIGDLVRKNILREDEWISLIQQRREFLIKPYLKSFTLPELGSVGCMWTDRVALLRHNLHDDDPKINSRGEFSLMTQGIFYETKYSTNDGKTGMKFICGLTRQDKLILAEIKYAISENPIAKYETATTINIGHTIFERILEITGEDPKNILCMLDNQILSWEKTCKERLEDISRIAAIMRAENFALQHIPVGIKTAYGILSITSIQQFEADINATELRNHYTLKMDAQRPTDQAVTFIITLSEAAVPLFCASLKDGALSKWKNEIRLLI